MTMPDRVWLSLATLLAASVAALLDHLTPLSTADWLLLLTAPAPFLFVIRYLRVRWYDTVSGRAIMLKSMGTAMFLALASTAVLAPNFPGRSLLRFAVYGFLFAAQWYLTALLFRLQAQPGHDPAADTLQETP